MIALKLLCYLQQWQQLRQNNILKLSSLFGMLVLGLTAAAILQGFDSEEREMAYYLQCISSFGL